MNRILEDLQLEIGSALLPTSLEEVSSGNHPCYALDSSGEIIGLNLSNLGLESIPRVLGSLQKLHTLRLFGNRLTALPAWLPMLENLKRLYLAENLFVDFPAIVSRIDTLEVLALNLNSLQAVDPEVGNLRKLRKLGLSSNRLNDLPDSLANLAKLEGIFLGGNNLAAVPEWIVNLQELQELTLSRNPISKVPSNFGYLLRLKSLGLRETGFRVFPLPVLNLPSLVKLDLNGVPITELPNGIGRIRGLQYLDLNGTQIDRLPDDFELLQELRFLNLSSLRLPEIPPQVFKLRKLEELNLSGTKSRAIPKEIATLINLINLDLSSMGLIDVPPEVFRLPNIQRLNLIGNRLRQLPWQLTESSADVFWAPRGQRTGIFVGRNPLESPPPEIIHSGTQAVHAYFQSMRGKSKPIDEVKVLLVGDGGAGKTSLVKQITGKQFNEHESQTHGINIEDFQINSRGKRIKVHFWDFGGQEIMHATHQFFLSKRSAYLLVLDGRKDEKTEYWLKHIEAFGGDSPVLVILNKIDQNASFDVNRRFLAEKYPSIKGFLRVSCKTHEGIAEILGSLSRALARIEHTKTNWALSWFNVKERLESMKEDFISYVRFQDLCVEQGIEQRVAQATLVDFLHDLGIVLHFRDLPLKDTNVINPRWVTDGVYRIVNSKEIVAAGGVLNLELLQEILDADTHPPDKHNFIIELMKKFELCYALDGSNILLPGLLPVEEPEVRFGVEKVVKFVIGYDFLPKSVMPRFIVRMHDDIERNHRWRTGVILYHRQLDTRALVRADEVERTISINVTGPHRREYLGVILYAFRQIHRTFEKLDFVEKVPMPDNSNISVSYKHLTLLESRGIRSFIPDGSEHEYDVQELLGWVKPQRKTEDDILEILQQLREKGESAESLLQKANKSILLQPNFFGVGVNLNELIQRVFKK